MGTVDSSGFYTSPSRVPGRLSPLPPTASYPLQHPAGSAPGQLSLVCEPLGCRGLQRVYRSMQAGTGYARINPTLEAATVYKDSNVSSGQTYFYAVTAVDSSGVESAYSNVAQATIP